MKLITKQTFRAFVFCLLTGLQAGAQNQNMTGSVVTQPCNNNGQISVTVTVLTPPINYTYTNYTTNQTVVHANINSTVDNLTNISAYQTQWGGNPNFWNVFASDGTNNANM